MFESSQKNESRVQSADSSKAYRKTSAFNWWSIRYFCKEITYLNWIFEDVRNHCAVY